MNNYVVGFIFSRDKSNILLIRKERPSWQVGKFNGVGGKIEQGEMPDTAIKRECTEETGMVITSWVYKGIISGPSYSVCVFTAEATIDAMLIAQSHPTDEPCKVFHINELDHVHTISQLRWLVPLLLDKEVIDIQIIQKDK